MTSFATIQPDYTRYANRLYLSSNCYCFPVFREKVFYLKARTVTGPMLRKNRKYPVAISSRKGDYAADHRSCEKKWEKNFTGVAARHVREGFKRGQGIRVAQTNDFGCLKRTSATVTHRNGIVEKIDLLFPYKNMEAGDKETFEARTWHRWADRKKKVLGQRSIFFFFEMILFRSSHSWSECVRHPRGNQSRKNSRPVAAPSADASTGADSLSRLKKRQKLVSKNDHEFF